jgi:hypothetical protein
MNQILKEYIDGCYRASNRTRFVLIIIVLSSILIFTAFWNSRQSSWTNLRLKRAKDSLKYEIWKKRNKKDIPKSKSERKDYEKAIEFAKTRNINNSKQMEELISELQNIQSTGIKNVHVRFLGIIIDVNDLGLLGGFTFSVLLLWFQLCLLREYENIRLVTSNTSITDRKLCYNLLSMHQVFTLPSVEDEPESRKKAILRKAPVVLFSLPLVIQTCVLLNDVASWEFGTSLSTFYTYLTFFFSAGFLFFIITLTILCFKIFTDIDRNFRN